MADKDELKQCFICQEKEAKYTCPKCNYPYCSLTCYKSEKHMKCSEKFYEQCFVEGLKDMKNDDESKKKMMEILNKMRKDEERDPNIKTLEDRIEGLDLDNDTEELWSRLTEEEKSEFERLCKKGNAFVEPWNPWWFGEDNLRPCLIDDVQPFNILFKKEPSKTLAYSLLNALLCYCYICRRFNGDYIDLSCEASQELQRICGPLACNETFNDIASTLTSFTKALKVDEKKEIGESLVKTCIIDVSHILKESSILNDKDNLTLLALSDLKNIFDKSIKELEENRQSTNRDKEKRDRKQYFQISKKLIFYMSWYSSNQRELNGFADTLSFQIDFLK